MKSIKALFVLALAFAFAVPAFAETQNVKVSGNIDAYGFIRDNYDLNKDGGSSTNTGDSGADEYFRTNTQIEVSADLTDNVSTVINVVNQRDWADASLPATATTNDDALSVNLDLAYVKMKEIFYSPLTLTIGRQDLWFGRGFIVGNNNHAWNPDGVLAASEYAVTTAFDAVRATLDFNPWTIDIAMAKISEGATALVANEDDVDLWIANVNYKFAEYNAVAEGYLVGEFDLANGQDHTGNQANNDTYTIGGRAQFDPISQITLGAELAYQGGDYHGTALNGEQAQNSRDRNAWAANIFGTYRFENAWKPEVTLEWVHFSGEEDLTQNSVTDYSAWNGLYRGKFWTAYGDFRQFVYTTDDTVDQSATTNQDLFQVKGALKPMEDLLLEGSFTYFWTPETLHTGSRAIGQSVDAFIASASRDSEIGWEIDFQATYDYTEDVSFGLLAGWFVPGEFYDGTGNDATATDIVSSVKVSF